LIIIGVVVTAPVERAEAAVRRTFTPRYRTNDRGDIIAIGNTSVACSTPTSSCNSAKAGAATSSNNDFTGVYVDVDGDASTANSSQATLTLPTGASVLWAGLYWMGSAASTNSSRGSVKFATPSAPYTTIAGTVTTGVVATLGGQPYSAVADVTSLVQASGTYTVADVTTTVGGLNARGGWSLVVVIRDPSQPLRNLSVFDGYAEINSSTADRTVTTTISGFQTPASGAVNARIGAVASEGDLDVGSEAFRLNTTTLSDTRNPATNFWNSSITRLGQHVTAKNPNYVNQFGLDIDYVNAPAGAIGNGQTSATVTFTTTTETYEPIALFTAIDIYEPNLTASKVDRDVNGGALNPGDVVEYSIALSSNGSEAASAIRLADVVPAASTYVPGSISIDGAAVSDSAGNDIGEYDAATRTIALRLGSGATSTAGGSLAPGATSLVTFRVTVNSEPPPASSLSNQGTITYASPATAKQYSTQTDDPDASGLSNATDFAINDSPVANAITATTLEDAPVTVSLAGASSDPDGDPLAYTTSAVPPTQGTLTCTAGSCTFAPAANINGPITFTYMAADAGGRSTTATVTIDVTPVNDQPVAVNDTFTVDEDTVGTFAVTSNDADVETANGSLAISAFTQGAKGSVSCTDGTCTYTPQPNVNGSDSFTYVITDGEGDTSTATVDVTVAPVQDAPLASGMSVSVNEDPSSPLTINVLDGDSDPDGDAVRLSGFTPPAAGTGTVTCTADTGPCRYTPPTNFSGTATFTYSIIDTADGSGRQSTATITVTVLPVNDRPVATNDTATVAEDNFVDIGPLLNDSDIDGGALRIPSFTQPASGTVDCGTLPGPGPCRYTPKPNFNGTDSFTYEVGDGNGGQSTGVVAVTVTAVNDVPVAVPDSGTTSEEAALTIDVVANDTDLDGHPLTITSADPTAPNGTVACSVSTCTYTPDTDFEGSDSFSYTVTDGAGGTASATVTIIVGAINDAPRAVADAATGAEDAPIDTEVLANDGDPDLEPIAISALAQPARGAVSCGTLPSTGSCTYTPNPNFNGTDSYTYTVIDPAGLTATATVTLTVVPVNDPPTAGNDAATTNEDTPTTIAVAAGDVDIDGDPLTFTAASLPASGTVSCTPAGACTYTPAGNFNGTDSFTYTVADPGGETATGTVQVVVTGVNDSPVADADSATVPEDSLVAINLLDGGTDPDGDPLTIAVVSSPANGAVSCGQLPSTTSCTYMPNPNFNGTDTFTYTVSDGRGGTASAVVTVTVNPVNDTPLAGNDAASTAEDTPVGVDVATNDSDVDGNPLTVSLIADSVVGGTVDCTPGGLCAFAPAPNFNGAAAFSYTVDDGTGGAGSQSLPATVSIAVQAVNDAPVAVADAGATDEDTAVQIDVRANDTDVESATLSIVSVTQPANGTVDCGTPPSTETCAYTPDANFSGTDTFTYTVADGNGATANAVATITVAPVNDNPAADPDSAATDEDLPVEIAVLDGDTDIDGDPLEITGSTDGTRGTVLCALDTCTYAPGANTNGTDTFTYTIADGEGGVATGTVTVLVRAANDPPAPDADSASTAEDQPVPIDVLVGDTDPDAGDPLTVAGNSNGTNGTVSCTTTQCTYAPNPNFVGTDTFSYTVRDGSGSSAAATVTVAVTAVNDHPQVLDRSVGTREDTATAAIPVLQGASDVDGDPVALVSATQGTNGGVSCTLPSGPCTYTPNPNFNGTDSFTFAVEDGNGGFDTGTVTVVIAPVNDLPSPQPNTATVAEDTTIDIAGLLANDTDPDGDTLVIVADAAPRASANGTVQCDADSCAYTPRLNFNGSDAFTYDVQDSAGARFTTLVSVTVTAVNDAPTPQDGSATTPEDTPLAVPVGFVLQNDTDPDGDPLEAISFTDPDPAHGSVSCNPPGPPYTPSTICTFTPAPDSTATATWTYTVRDPSGATATATITVFVGPVNDAPAPQNDAPSTAEDTPIDVAVLANDTDSEDPDGLAVVADAQPRLTSNGRVQCDADSCAYTPRLNFNGTDSFTYDVEDTDGARRTATVTVTVTPVNDPPTPQDGTGVTPEDTPMTVPVGFVLSNDTDPDGDALQAIEFTQPDPGTGSASCPGVPPYANSTLCTFTPAPNFVGETTFEYTVTDPGGLVATATITVVVTPVNDAPVVPDQAVTTVEDTAIALNALQGATDAENDPLSVSPPTQPTHGTASCTPGGACTYTPSLNSFGPDAFSVTVTDANGGADTVTFTLDVTPINDNPTAGVVEAETDEDAPVTFDGLAGATDPDPGNTLTIAGVLVAPPTGGTVACAPTGSCTYTPNANFHGTDTFTYTIVDGQGGSTSATATVRVNPINDVPIAADDAPAAIAEDSGAVAVEVLGNDGDSDGDPLEIVGATQGTKGTFTCDAAACTYTPFDHAYGSDTVTYTIADGEGGFDTATVAMTITPSNDAPVGAPLGLTTTEDTDLAFDALGGVSDVDSTTLTVMGPATQPANGTVTCGGHGPCTFTPNGNVTGNATFDVTISDGADGVLVRTVTIAITAVNDPPVPSFADAGTVAEDGTLAGLNVLAAATDPDAGDTISFVSATNGAKGAVACTPTGVCTYTPAANAVGADTFTYTIRDTAGTEVSRTVTVSITAINDAPTAPAQSIGLDEDDSATIDLLAGASDAEGHELSVEITDAPDQGTLDCEPDNTCVYTPNGDFAGTDTVTVRVTDGNGGEISVAHTFTVTEVNDAPVAAADSAITDEDVAVVVEVLLNDTDPEDPSALTVVTPNPVAANGTVACDPGAGTCTYSPGADFFGTDAFSYTVHDAGGLAASATATVTVNSVNDAPVAPAIEAATTEDSPLVIDPLAGARDADGDALTVEDADVAAGATFDCGALPSTGPCTFTPPPNSGGSFVVGVTIGDGTTTITRTITIVVAAVNDAPAAGDIAVTTDEDNAVAVPTAPSSSDPDGTPPTLESWTQPANGVATCEPTAGACTYTPALNFAGPTDTFTYTVVDADGSHGTGTVTVTVRPVNDAPTPGSGSGTTPEDTPLFVNVAYVLANDTDPDPGDTFQAISFTQPANGTATCFGPSPYALETICRYAPNANFVGTDSFTYIVRDTAGATAMATITVFVTAVNDAPTVADEAVQVVEDTPTPIPVLANDSDVEGDPLTIVQVGQPQFGTVDCGALPSAGPCTYTPNSNSNAADSFTYVVTDGALTTVGTATITIQPVNDPPQAPDRSFTTPEEQPVVIGALDGAIDPDGTPVTFASFTQPAAGTGTVDCAAEVCTYTPPLEYSGTTTFTLSFEGVLGAATTATITITVAPTDDPPAGGADALTIDEDSGPAVVPVLDNDSDPEGLPLTVVGFTQGAIGAATCTTGPVPAATCTYTPAVDASGPDTFSYTLSDGVNETVVSVTVSVTPVPDPPVAGDDAATVDEDHEVVVPVLLNDLDPDGGTPGNVAIITPAESGTVRVNPDSGEIAYTPANDASGVFPFQYQTCDVDGLCAIATVTVTVNPVPDDPVAEDASAVTDRDLPVMVGLLEAVSDVDGDLDASTLRLTSSPASGQAALHPDGTATYTPNAGFTGGDSFTYEICDTRAVCVERAVRVDVVVPSIAPDVADDAAEARAGEPVAIDVLANDTAPGRPIDPSSLAVNAPPANGTVALDPVTGVVTYTPAPDFAGIDQFTYEVCEQPGVAIGEGVPLPPPKCAAAVAAIVVQVAPPVPPVTDPGSTPAPPGTQPPPGVVPPTIPPAPQPPAPPPTAAPTAPPSVGGLPRTGGDTSMTMPYALLLLTTGLLAVALAGRRRRRER
jgi:VCBS repeat-containing protein